MSFPYMTVVYFFYGLSFFSMGLLVAVEGGRSSDPRLRRALRPLAGFGLIHAFNEWLEMFELIAGDFSLSLNALRFAILTFSFLSLAAFGSYLLVNSQTTERLSMLVPLTLEAVWVFGLLVWRNRYVGAELWAVADVWTRYSIAIPASLLTAVGLVVQQRTFRMQGLIRFGQDALWAAIVFGWYGLVGQMFPHASALPPSNVINSDLFLEIFGFPIQLFRATMASAASIFVIRFLRAFQVEIEKRIADLQSARLLEAQERERLRQELFGRVVAAQEMERQRIARELHDETGQALTAIGLGLHAAASALKKNKRKDAIEELHHLETLTTNSLHELQRLIADLRPSHLDDLGLPSALRWYAGDVERRSSLQVQVEIAGEEREIDANIKTAIFRIVQESLTNVIKHADAKNAHVFLKYGDNEVFLRVEDDGRGFDVKATRADKYTSWGLRNMEERVALLGGTCSIRSQPGTGARIEVSIPYVQRTLEEK